MVSLRLGSHSHRFQRKRSKTEFLLPILVSIGIRLARVTPSIPFRVTLIVARLDLLDPFLAPWLSSTAQSTGFQSVHLARYGIYRLFPISAGRSLEAVPRSNRTKNEHEGRKNFRTYLHLAH